VHSVRTHKNAPTLPRLTATNKDVRGVQVAGNSGHAASVAPAGFRNRFRLRASRGRPALRDRAN